MNLVHCSLASVLRHVSQNRWCQAGGRQLRLPTLWMLSSQPVSAGVVGALCVCVCVHACAYTGWGSRQRQRASLRVG